MRLGYQNHLRKNSDNSSNFNPNYQDNNSDNEEYSSHQEADMINSKLNKSFTDDSSSKPKKSSNQIKEKTYYQFIAAILIDDKNYVEKIINSSPNQGIGDHPSIEGLTPIQYAALYGSLNCFKYLMNNVKVDTDRKAEGLNLIHISLCRAIFKNEKDNCIKMFQYIYDKLPKQRELKDRLGRTFLHIIFEYDFNYAFEKISVNLDELFVQDNNGDFVINYVYIYNSSQCFWNISKNPEHLSEIYKEIRIRYENNKKAKESFLGNLFIHQNYYAIAIIIVNCSQFINELLEDLNNLKSFYSSEINENNLHDYHRSESKDIYNLSDNINYALNIVTNMKNGGEFSGKFNFPQKIRCFSAIVYNYNCIQHIKLPEEPLKHLMVRISIFENSDRLAGLIDTEKNGIILNDQVLHYEKGVTSEEKVSKSLEHTGCENIIFHETNRKSCLNDILKCHDLNYIQNLKRICLTKPNNSSFKKHENHDKNEKGLNIPKILSKLDTTNPLYKNFFNTNYQSHFRKLDVDTYINESSFDNIFNTSGCVLDAIDLVLQNKTKNALVLIRPPGHNAGYFGPVENIATTSSAGFCLVNNIAIGAAYVKNKYRNEIVKVAIFDFDAHHGNGTEEIVQMLNSKIFEKKFVYDKLCEIKTRKIRQINWADEEDAKNVLYISTHIYEEKNDENNFYPFSGSTETNTDKKSPIYPGGIYNIPMSSKNNVVKGDEYRSIIKTKVIPRLYEFKPDIIFLSAGFDCHENEIINQKNIALNEFDFAFITQQMQFVANKFCKGRLISVLEGGYNISTGIISSFEQSVFTHAKFLNLSINMFQIFDVKLTGIKRQPQDNIINNNEEEKVDNTNNEKDNNHALDNEMKKEENSNNNLKDEKGINNDDIVEKNDENKK